MKTLLILAVAMSAAILAGCMIRGSHGGIVAVIPTGHVHSNDCGHYSHGDSWYFSAGHHHGDSCGHHYSNGVWIVRN